MVIDKATPCELDWIFEQLQNSEIHVPLSLPEPPSREDFDRGELLLVEEDGPDWNSVRYFILRFRASGKPWGFYLEYGWAGSFDSIREIDLAASNENQGSFKLMFEAAVLGAQFAFVNQLGKRVRWRIQGPRENPPRWFKKIGAHYVGGFLEPHPLTGELLSKHVYELSRRELERVFQVCGVDLSVDWAKEQRDFWQLFR